MSTKKIGILYICTGNYTLFWKEFYLSMEKNFITDAEKHYFVFTDSTTIDFENENPCIHRIHQNDLGWPDNTLKRFHMFLKHENVLQSMDYLFFFNANLQVLKNVTSDEFLPHGDETLVATLHPGFFNKERSKFTYENNPKSKAYISKDQGTYYFAGGLNGGITGHFIDAIKIMMENVDTDESSNITAIWHDESHWNKYLIDRNDVKILQPSYLYPEGWDIPFDQIIRVRDKNKYGGHNKLRKEKNAFQETLKKTLKNLLILSRKKSLIVTNGINIQNAPLLIVSIAYNNSDVLKIQHKYLKENLEEDFLYLIADNSNNKLESSLIEEYSHKQKIPYVKLPNNHHKNPSKSHGTALQWAYKNIIEKYHPHYFGFIDHDIFPERKTSITSKLRNGIFGLIQERNEKWYLWPGFCFYDFNRIKDIELNFMPCKGLDTGGSNYYKLYKDIDKSTLFNVPHTYSDTVTGEKVPIITDENTANTVEHIGDWLHIMRASNWNNQKNSKTYLFKTEEGSKNTIDVVIPVYNGQDFIIDALESVVKQTLSPRTVIVVDDGSTDDTHKIVSEYALSSKVEIKIIKKINGGLSSARNAGIKESTSDFIAFLDADDVWIGNKLEEQIDIYKTTKFKNLALIYCNYDVIDSHGVIQYTNYKAPLDNKRMRGMVFQKLLKRNRIASSGSGVLIKRDIFEDVGLFDEKLKFGEDWDMWLRIARKYDVDFSSKTLVHIRKHEYNMTAQPSKVFENELGFYNKWVSMLHGYPIPLFWADKITFRIISGFPKNNLFIVLKNKISKDNYRKLFRQTCGSFYLYLPLFFIRQIFNLFFSRDYLKTALGLVKHKGK
jgi:glycosyltransferase involved in cell wall biosynthesis